MGEGLPEICTCTFVRNLYLSETWAHVVHKDVRREHAFVWDFNLRCWCLNLFLDTVSSKLQNNNVYTIAKRNVEGQDMLYQSLKLTNGIWILAELRIQPGNPNYTVRPFSEWMKWIRGGRQEPFHFCLAQDPDEMLQIRDTPENQSIKSSLVALMEDLFIVVSAPCNKAWWLWQQEVWHMHSCKLLTKLGSLIYLP